MIPRENEDLLSAQKYLSDHHHRSQDGISTKRTLASSKYTVSIVESSYIAVMDDSAQLKKGDLDGKDALQVDLRCNFGKPFVEYSCTLLVKNDQLKDIRYYKLVTSVAMKPKIVDIEVKVKARETTFVKIPVKIAPC